MLVKAVIVILLLVILFALGSSFYFMVRDAGEGTRTLRRLAWRVALSLILLAVLYGLFVQGWIEPSGGPINMTGRG